ncbi:histidine kinase [Rufibacter psychrotolerans]|uniref:histidine kinase n=1 Tax=Rufibacter psychrotolerans TaxID=2812556 RepID=UPI001967A8A0|nr:histidine kinase [Rufibacter sp. SYSU D00308]
MNQAQVDFQQLRIKHILFKSKVRSVLYGGTLDATFFSSSGPINIWFNSVGLSRYRNVAEMLELKQVQQELSTTADSLFALYERGKIDEAQNGLAKIEKLSGQFLALLSKLEGKLAA